MTITSPKSPKQNIASAAFPIDIGAQLAERLTDYRFKHKFRHETDALRDLVVKGMRIMDACPAAQSLPRPAKDWPPVLRRLSITPTLKEELVEFQFRHWFPSLIEAVRSCMRAALPPGTEGEHQADHLF